MNIKWTVLLLCLVLFIVVNEAKKYEGKGKDVQKDKYEKNQKGKSTEEFSKSGKVDKKTKVKKSARNSKPVESAPEVKTVADKQRDGKRQKREASGSKIGSNEKPMVKVKKSEIKEQKNVKSKNLPKSEKSKNYEKNEKVADVSANSNVKAAGEEFAVPSKDTREKNVKTKESKKVSKKQKREANPADVITSETNADLKDQSFQPAAEKDVPLKNEQSKKQAKKEKKEKLIEKIDAQKTPEVDVVSVVEEV